jgi:hypothetical protein
LLPKVDPTPDATIGPATEDVEDVEEVRTPA